MKRALPASISPCWGPLAPQWGAILGRAGGDWDAWLGAANAVALAFLLLAWGAALPDEAGKPGAADLLAEPGAAAFLVVDLPPAAAAGAQAEEAAAAEGEVAEGEVAAAVYPELGELVEPVAIREPTEATREVVARPAVRPAGVPERPAGGALRGAGGAAGSRSGGRELAVASGPGRAAGPVGLARMGGGGGSNPQPPYPAFARRQRLQGTVVLRIAVRNGAVAEVVVARSSGSAGLDRHAAGHVQRSWRWAPGTEQTFTQSFRFVLQ